MEICLFHAVYAVKDTEISINGFFFLKAKTHGQWENEVEATKQKMETFG